MPRIILLSYLLTVLAACSAENPGGMGPDVSAPVRLFPQAEHPPAAERRPYRMTQHGQARIDPYYWLRDDNWQDLLRDPLLLKADIRSHLEAENAYYEQATAELEGLRTRLVKEMQGRMEDKDSTVPATDGPWAYARRYREGGEYPLFVRTPREGGEEQLLFDGDAESQGSAFFRVLMVRHSPDHSRIAYSVDRTGSEVYDIRVRHIDSGQEFPETVASTGSPVWAADSRSFFYVERDDSQRPKWLRRHVLGTDPATDELVYEEADDAYFLFISESQSGEYLFIQSQTWGASDARFLRLDAPPGTPPSLIAPRRADEEYQPFHHGDDLYLLTNAGGAVDYKVVRAPIANPGREHWEDWLPHRPGVYVIDMLPLKNRMVLLTRENALPRISIYDWSGEGGHSIEFDEAAYSLGLLPGFEYATDTLRFTYESPSTPQETFDYDLESRDRVLRKVRRVPSGHDPGLYRVERLFVEADDGARIPVTVLRLKSAKINGSAPLYLYGYGSYGLTEPAVFSRNILSLVDRGVIFAIGHVRGGAALGRQWYLDGKLDNKHHSFSDFAQVAQALQARGYGAPGNTVIRGDSAGGLLVGATVNLRPDLFAGVISSVPFVDVLTTMSDASLPLTPPEWGEWGNPVADPEAYADIAAYSPYDNIRGGVVYPPVFATGALADYRVPYWEPAKWIARLRAEAKGGPFFLKTDMAAGHSGTAARFRRLEEAAEYYAFALKLFGLESATPVAHSPAD